MIKQKDWTENDGKYVQIKSCKTLQMASKNATQNQEFGSFEAKLFFFINDKLKTIEYNLL